MESQFFKKQVCVFFLGLLAALSLLMMLPAVQDGILYLAESLVVRRPLRDAGKWSRLILRWASGQLLLSLALLFLRLYPVPVSGSLTRLEACRRRMRPLHVLSFLLVAAFAVQNLLYMRRGDSSGWYMDSTNLWDLYVSILGSRGGHLGMYPPIASLVYRCLSAMVPEELLSGDWNLLAYSDGGSYVTLLFYLSSIVPFCLLCYEAVEGTAGEKLLATLALCCSVPFLYSLARGNIVLLSACCAFFFCRSLRSENVLVRAAGLLALFAAVGTKLYPVAFAMLLVKERRWKLLGSCLAMGLPLFVFLLSFFEGGLAELCNLFRGIMRFTSSFTEHHNLSLKRQVWDLLSFFGGGKAPGGGLFSVVHGVVLLFYLAISALLFFMTGKRWVELMLLTLSCLLLPNIVRPYTEVFLVIPIVEMLNCREKDVCLYLSFLFLLPMLLFLCGLSVFTTFHSAISTFPLFVLCAVEVARERDNPARKRAGRP